MRLVTEELLHDIADKIVAAIHPEKIFLFGSRAWGNPGEASDVDLFVIVSESDQPAYRRARDVYRCIRGMGAAVDVIVQTRDEVERSRNVATSLAKRVLEQGRKLYG
jgi:predicted nucleotidyltransferase